MVNQILTMNFEIKILLISRASLLLVPGHLRIYHSLWNEAIGSLKLEQ